VIGSLVINRERSYVYKINKQIEILQKNHLFCSVVESKEKGELILLFLFCKYKKYFSIRFVSIL
jgi:hypothetical protein